MQARREYRYKVDCTRKDAETVKEYFDAMTIYERLKQYLVKKANMYTERAR